MFNRTDNLISVLYDIFLPMEYQNAL